MEGPTTLSDAGAEGLDDALRRRRREDKLTHGLLSPQVDNLDAYFESNQYPEMLRLKLREYVKKFFLEKMEDLVKSKL